MTGDVRNSSRFLMNNEENKTRIFPWQKSWHQSKQSKSYHMNKTLFGQVPFFGETSHSSLTFL